MVTASQQSGRSISTGAAGLTLRFAYSQGRNTDRYLEIRRQVDHASGPLVFSGPPLAFLAPRPLAAGRNGGSTTARPRSGPPLRL